MAIESASKTLVVTVNDLAVALARKHGLFDETTGEIRCWKCKGPGAMLPTLRCRRCGNSVSEAPRQLAIDAWIAMADTLRDHPRITRERGEQLLERAGRRWDATPGKLANLRQVLDRRFAPVDVANDPRFRDD